MKLLIFIFICKGKSRDAKRVNCELGAGRDSVQRTRDSVQRSADGGAVNCELREIAYSVQRIAYSGQKR